MAQAIARVELHGATAQDYTTLHAAMQQRGFSRTIRGSDQSVYQLPTGEYIHSNVPSSAQALTLAQQAATQTGKSAAIFVGGWDGAAAWSGLSVVGR